MAFNKLWVVSPGYHRLVGKNAVVEIVLEVHAAPEEVTVRFLVNGQQVDSIDVHTGPAAIEVVAALKRRVFVSASTGNWPPT
jgi:hypothetical protein